MSDCLQNEDSIVSDLSSSNADSLTGTLDSGDNINSDISIGDAMVSSISDGDSTDSNLGDDGSLYSELVIGGGGGVKYTGQETDSIVITVDNNVYTISASLQPIKFDSVADFPKTGSERLIYVDFSNKALYGWDSKKGVYYKLVADVKIPTKLSEFTNDAGFITNTVNNLVEYYKKTETYTQEEIDSKISAIPKFAIKVVTELPTTDISETTVYLVASGSDNQNLYIEYIYVDGAWEKLGEQTLDLSDVVKSVNGKTGTVQLTASDVNALPSSTSYIKSVERDSINKQIIKTTKVSDGQQSSSILFSIADDLNTDSSTDVLSAKQGVVLRDKISNSVGNTKIYYGVSSTLFGSQVNTVDCPDFKLEEGVVIFVRFGLLNMIANQTMNVNGTGEKPMVINNNNDPMPAFWWGTGGVLGFIYREGYYHTIDDVASTQWYGRTRLTSSVFDSEAYALTPKAGKELSDRITALEEGGGGTKIIWEVWE